MVLQADKYMGVCILNRKKFIKQTLQEHLRDNKTYNVLTAAEASAKKVHICYLFHGFINAHKDALNNPIRTFMLQSYQLFGDKILTFRTTVKIHKNLWKLHPIVSNCGTILEYVSKWLDFKLQKLVTLMPAVIKNSWTIRDKPIALDLPKIQEFSQLMLYQCTQTLTYMQCKSCMTGWK